MRRICRMCFYCFRGSRGLGIVFRKIYYLCFVFGWLVWLGFFFLY